MSESDMATQRALYVLFSGRFDYLSVAQAREMIEGQLAIPCGHGAADWSTCAYCQEGAPR